MNRRQIMLAAGASLATTLIGIPAWARPAMTFQGRVHWMHGTLDSPHAALVARSIADIIKDGELYTSGDAYLGHMITLSDPTFMVVPTDIMWHPTRGYRFEPGLELEVNERGVLIGRARMYSNADYEAYWQKPLPPEQPLYGIKTIHTPFDKPDRSTLRIRNADWQVVEERVNPFCVTIPDLEAALGRDAVRIHSRWIQAIMDGKGGVA